MKVTVSSTSMMKPILYSKQISHSSTQHPQRVLGLLEWTGKQSLKDELTVYHRPATSAINPNPVCCHHFLQASNPKAESRIAVFGFEFDGDKTWYQLWNQASKEVCWLLHEDAWDYQTYAIMAMDALVTLLPEWNGELYLNLSEGKTAHSLPQANNALVDKRYDLQVADAATTPNGQLWFLVTVNAADTQVQKEALTSAEHLRTGWISQRSTVQQVA